MYSSHVRRSAVSLLDSGISYNEVSRRLGINRSTLRDWRTNRSLIEKYRDDACPRCEPIPRPPTRTESYGYLLGLYLGDGSISPTARGDKGVWRLRVFCSDGWPGLIEECASAMTALRPDHPIGRVRCSGCTEVCSDWKHWPCLFPQHGPGKKHERPIVLEPWQQKIVDEQPEAFVRGLMHSDGCRLINRIRKKLPQGGERTYEYPRYQFVNTSTDIIDLLTGALDDLGVDWKSHVRKREPRYRDATVVSISRRDAVARMDSFVGPKY